MDAAVLDATLGALDRAGAGGANRLGVPLAGQVDLGRVGVIGHSRGGMNVVRWATGRATVLSALLVRRPGRSPASRRAGRPAPSSRPFLASVARDHFGATQLGAAPAAWQDLGAAVPSSVHGLDVSVARFPAG